MSPAVRAHLPFKPVLKKQRKTLCRARWFRNRSLKRWVYQHNSIKGVSMQNSPATGDDHSTLFIKIQLVAH
jgi:hypothetical protein